MNSSHEIESKLAGARSDLTAALERGDDTTEFRKAVVVLEQELTAAQRSERAAEIAQQRAEEARLSDLADAATDEAHSALASASGASVVAGVEMPSPETDPAIANAAARLVAACDRLEREDARYLAAYNEWSKINGRLVEKQRRRDEIVQRRTSGDERPEDGAELTALNLDIGSLQSISSDKHIAAEQLRPNAAKRLVADAEAALKRAQDMALINVRKARVRALELALIEEHTATVNAIVSNGGNQFSLPMLRDLQRIVHRTSTWEDR